MRHLSAVSVEAEFATTPPDVSGVAGVTAIEVVGTRLRCHVAGSMEAFLGVLTAAGVRQILSTEPSLEEVFLAHYGVNAAPPGTPDAA